MLALRALGAVLMAAGALVMAFALVVAGNARILLLWTLDPLALILMRQAWAAVAGGAVLVLAGLFVLRRVAEREAQVAAGA